MYYLPGNNVPAGSKAATLRGMKMGPRRGSLSTADGRANGSTGTGSRCMPQLPALRPQLVTWSQTHRRFMPKPLPGTYYFKTFYTTGRQSMIQLELDQQQCCFHLIKILIFLPLTRSPSIWPVATIHWTWISKPHSGL